MKNSLLISFLFPMILASNVYAGDLPLIPVGPVSFNKTPIREAIDRLFNGTGIEISYENMPDVAVTVNRLGGMLPDVMDKLSKSSSISYRYEAGVIHVGQVNTGIVPPKFTVTPQSQAAPVKAVKSEPVKPAAAPAVEKVKPVEEVKPAVTGSFTINKIEDANVSLDAPLQF